MKIKRLMKQSRKTQSFCVCLFFVFFYSLDLNSSESVWFEHRFKMLDSSIELLKKQKEEEEKEKEKEKEENNDDLSCARCRIHHRKNDTNNQLLHKLKQIHNEHNYSIQYSTLGFII